MANAQQQENMLLTEHFTWPPISLIDDIINAVNEVLYRCTDSFEQGISSADASLLGFADRYAAEKRTPERDEDGNDVYPEAALEIEEGVLKLETLMENAVDKNFDRLEIWTLRNVLCLPRGEDELARWVRLGHYANLDTSPRDPSLTPEKLYELRRSLLETQKLNKALLAEKERNDALIARLKSLVQPPVKSERASTEPVEEAPAPFAFLTHTPAAQSLGVQGLPSTAAPTAAATAAQAQHESRPTPLSTHTNFSTSQLPYLRQLLSTLSPHLATTALPSSASSGPGGADVAKASRERKAYVESQSRRILERRGVDTREGVAGEGGRVRGEEVRALEGLVGGLGRGKKEDEGKGGGDGGGDGGANGDAEEDGNDADAMDTS